MVKNQDVVCNRSSWRIRRHSREEADREKSACEIGVMYGTGQHKKRRNGIEN